MTSGTSRLISSQSSSCCHTKGMLRSNLAMSDVPIITQHVMPLILERTNRFCRSRRLRHTLQVHYSACLVVLLLQQSLSAQVKENFPTPAKKDPVLTGMLQTRYAGVPWTECTQLGVQRIPALIQVLR